MVIFDADLDEEKIRSDIESRLAGLEKAGAERGYVDVWGKRRLAYEINHKIEGYYVVFQFRSEPDGFAEMDRSLSPCRRNNSPQDLETSGVLLWAPEECSRKCWRPISRRWPKWLIGNNITVVGNLTRDPEMRFTPSGLWPTAG